MPNFNNLEHLQNYFLENINRYLALDECKKGNHKLGWSQQRSNIICSRCKLYLLPVLNEPKPEILKKIIEEKVKVKQFNEWYNLLEQVFTSCNKQDWDPFLKGFYEFFGYEINNLDFSSVYDLILNFKNKCEILLENPSIEKLESLELTKFKIWDGFDKLIKITDEFIKLNDCKKGKHNLKWDDTGNIVCGICNYILKSVSNKDKKQWEEDFFRLENPPKSSLPSLRSLPLELDILFNIKECLYALWNGEIGDQKQKRYRPTMEMWQNLEKIYENKDTNKISYIKQKIEITSEIEKEWDIVNLIDISTEINEVVKKISELGQQEQILNKLDFIGRLLKFSYEDKIVELYKKLMDEKQNLMKQLQIIKDNSMYYPD